MTDKEKKDFLSGLKSDMTDTELLSVVDGIFEKVFQTTVQPLSLVPNSDWDKWDDFILKNRIKEKFQEVLFRMINENHSSFMILPNEDGDASKKVDVLIPVSTGQLFTNRDRTSIVKSAHVIAEQYSLLYGASTDTKMISFVKKAGVVSKAYNIITANGDGGFDYPKAIANSGGFLPTGLKTIPIVWFAGSFLTPVQKQMIAANKKMAVKILKEVVAQLQVAGPNLLLVGSANNTTTQATATKKAVLKQGSRVNTINESLNKTVQNPILSFNNQPWFKEFWELIESMANSLVEGLQVGDMNQGGKGTANMHDTEVATSFGVKGQKIINTQNMFLSSWDLFAKVIRENGVSIPAKVKFTFDTPDNVLVNVVKQSNEAETPETPAVVKDPAEGDE